MDIDIGGTMTDGLFSDGNTLVPVKVETTPHDFTVCFFDCLREGAKNCGYDDLAQFLSQVKVIRWSSTIATNVLAEGKGPKLGLLISEGHASDLYGSLTSPAVPKVIQPEHIVPVSDSLSEEEILLKVRGLLEKGVRRICISLKGAYEDPRAEQRIKSLIEEQFPDHYLGAVPVLLGSDILHHPDDQTRTHLALINSYVHTPLAVSLFKAEDDLMHQYGYRKPVYIGHVNGGVARVAKTKGVDTTESGPVFGLQAAAYFAKQYALDKVITLDVGGTTTKLGLILDEALEVFQRSSRSNMGVAGDVMIAIFNASGDLVNAAAGTYLHAIIQPIIIKYILKNYKDNPGIKDGDIWFANDALYGGIHNPDMVCIIPIFYDGKLIGWAGAANHLTETGAIEPGGMPVSAKSRFEEGLGLPPVKIGENHQIREDWLEVFSLYGIRAPQMMITDLKARATAADRVRTRILELCQKEGADFVIGLMRKMLDVAEEGARKRLASWPDGKFRCVTFSDLVGSREGLLRQAYVTLEKRGDKLIYDLTGTSPENHSSYHAHVQAVVGHVANYIYSYVFYDLPISSATFAPIEFKIPAGTLFNPDHKAATSNSVMICAGIMSASANTFAKMMFCTQDWRRVVASSSNAGNAMVISGISQWGLPFADMIAYSLNTEGQGGRPWQKGMNAFGFPWCPFGRAPNVELMENEFPLLVLLSQHWADSCGHGKMRGGVGTAQIWVAHQAPQVYFMSIADNSKVQTPQPLFGGYAPCTVPGIAIRQANIVEKLKKGESLDLDVNKILQEQAIDGQWEIEFFGRSARPYQEGDVISFGFSAGGAGYGDPLEADPQSVAQDIVNKIITKETAERVYKVVFDEKNLNADEEKTAELRRKERKARLSRGKRYAQFVKEWEKLKPPKEILHAYGSWPEAKAEVPLVRI